MILKIIKNIMKPSHRENDFSNFVVHAKAAEQKQLLTRVVVAASEDQKKTIERAKLLNKSRTQPAF
jgi:hypothetical protein